MDLSNRKFILIGDLMNVNNPVFSRLKLYHSIRIINTISINFPDERWFWFKSFVYHPENGYLVSRVAWHTKTTMLWWTGFHETGFAKLSFDFLHHFASSGSHFSEVVVISYGELTPTAAIPTMQSWLLFASGKSQCHCLLSVTS